MKKLILLLSILISINSISQIRYTNPSKIIGKPVKIGNLLVAQNDIIGGGHWDDAVRACSELGTGWRLPTASEILILYKNGKKIGGFSYGLYYWTSRESGNGAYYYDFEYNSLQFTSKEYPGLTCYVRAVKTIN